MISPVVGEKNYPLRIAPEVYEAVKALAEKHERSANWVMARLLRKAVAEDAAWLGDALR